MAQYRAPEPVVRPPRPGEEGAILEVLQAAFGPSWPDLAIEAEPLDHLRWKMASPATDPKLHRVVELDGRIVGCNLTLAREVMVRGRRLGCMSGGDAATHPDFQGRGLYTALQDYTTSVVAPQFEAWIGDTSHDAVQRIWEAAGRGYLAAPLQSLFKPLSRGRLAMRQGQGRSRWLIPARLARMIAYELVGRLRYRRPERRCGSVSLRVADQFDERADGLAMAAAGEFEFIGFRDTRYLNWRYCDPRGGGFRVVVAEAGDELLGYVASRRHGDRVVMADLLAAPGRLDVADQLIEESVRHFAASEVLSIWTSLPASHPYNGLLRAHGFISTQTPRPYEFDAPRGDPDVLEIASDPSASVHLMPGDGDEV